jgi:hypothetical protein
MFRLKNRDNVLAPEHQNAKTGASFIEKLLITPMGKVSWNKSSDDKWTTYSPKQARE